MSDTIRHAFVSDPFFGLGQCHVALEFRCDDFARLRLTRAQFAELSSTHLCNSLQ